MSDDLSPRRPRSLPDHVQSAINRGQAQLERLRHSPREAAETHFAGCPVRDHPTNPHLCTCKKETE